MFISGCARRALATAFTRFRASRRAGGEAGGAGRAPVPWTVLAVLWAVLWAASTVRQPVWATAAAPGVGAASVDGPWSDIAAVVLGAGSTAALMRLLGAVHPPAAAAGCLIALQPLGDWPVALVLLLAGAAVAACATAVRAGVHSTG